MGLEKMGRAKAAGRQEDKKSYDVAVCPLGYLFSVAGI
jgi:hypothetical protein